jgi:hypothetical protein
MDRKFWLSAAVMFALSMAAGYVVHGVVLFEDYGRLASLFRPPAEAEAYFAAMLVAHVFIAVAFVWIYLKGKEDKPFLAQGLRYGAAIVALVTIPTYLIYYAVQPMPGFLVAKQIVLDGISVLIMGVVLAWMNR